MKYKVVHISEMESHGYDLGTLGYILLGKGKFVVLEFSDCWFPFCGENRFPNKILAEQAIKSRIEMEEE